jgi:predicted peroxiredoxin
MIDLNAIESTDIVDTRGSACPGPFLEAKKASAKFRSVRNLKFFPTTNNFLEFGGELHVCAPCIKQRNIEESTLPEGSKITAAGQVNIMAIKADAVFVY